MIVIYQYDLNSLIVGAIGFIGALLGGYLSYKGSIKAYENQFHKEQRNVAKAIYTDLKNIYDSPRFSEYYNSHKDDVLEAEELSLDKIDIPGELYDEKTLLYFAFKESLTKLDLDISIKISKFYNNLFLAEKDRFFVMIKMKNFAITNSNPELKEGTLKGAKDMKALFINCGKKVSEICDELEEIYNLVS